MIALEEIFNTSTAVGALMTLIDFTVERQAISLVNGEPLGSERVNNVKNYVPINALTAVGALMTLIDFTITPDDFTREWGNNSSGLSPRPRST